MLSVLGLSSYAQAQSPNELGAPQQAAVDPATAAALGQIQAQAPTPFTLNGMLEAGLGQGAFLANRYARNPYFGWGVSVVPAYYPKPEITLSIYAKLSQELTDSDVDNHPYQPIFADMQLRARYVLPEMPVLGINTFTELRAYLPTSRLSQYETMVTALLARLTFIRSFGPIVLAAGGYFRKNFHRYQSPVVEAGGRVPSLYARAGGIEDLRGSAIAIAGNNVSFATQGWLAISYVPLPSFSISLLYGVSNAWTYRSYPKDERSGVYAKAGRGQRDTAWGGLDLWYRFTQRFSMSAGVFTAANPKTEDTQSFRFPFYDFNSTASNLTTFYLNLVVTEYLGG
ncbi:MAG TPA: hypothetical protein VMF89_13420 [Polyangiales bacterium]|nr:hypothetical protein [Polyangiales bacterium]